MIIKIKTTLIEIVIEDEPTITSDGYTKRSLPEMPTAIKSAIKSAIRLHKEVFQSINNPDQP